MSVVASLALAALGFAIAERWRRTQRDGFGVDGAAICGAVFLALVGLAATLLATVGQLHAIGLTIVSTILALASWPWRAPRKRASWRPSRRAITVVAILIGAVALRLPMMSFPLGGRDQGTYELRARHTLRSGKLDLVDPVLEAAGAELATRAGPADILGLYPRGKRAIDDVNEGAYRPGFYLASRERGAVVPQFLHLHPTLLAATGIVVGPDNALAVVMLAALLAIVAIWAVAVRVWSSVAWALIATSLFAFSPLAIWVHRTALSETLTGALLWAGVLAALRSREGEPWMAETAAFLIGTIAWVRGNGFFMAAVVLAALWLTRSARERRSGAIVLGLACASVVLHSLTAFPYIGAEVQRQLRLEAVVSPQIVIGACLAGGALWITIDRLLQRRHSGIHQRVDRVTQLLPRVLVGLAAAAIAAYAIQRGIAPPRPFSRLDPVIPLLGWPLTALACIGLVASAWRWRPARGAGDVLLIGVGGVVVVTLALYSQRNLPQLSLYYYGRYLVPELLPLACLLAAATLREFHGRVRRVVARLAAPATVALAAGLGWSAAGVLATEPITRLAEFRAARTLIDWLAEATPAEAVVIAGGEGWKHSHTFNQVGGALAVARGRTVLPYRNAEAAYASLHELLIAGPAARGTDPPAVFLLLNEAAHTYERADGSVIAGIDDILPAPFRAREVTLLELYLNRLKPVTDAVPTDVWRDDLRMALVRVAVDPDAAAAVQTWLFEDGEVVGPRGLSIASGALWNEGRLCLRRNQALVIDLPDEREPTFGSLVVIASPGTAERNHSWSISVDGIRQNPNMPRAHNRERDTLGPFVLSDSPGRVSLRGTAKRVETEICPHGALAEIRLLPSARGQLSASTADALVVGPWSDLGHPIAPVGWVSARALSRYRPGIRPQPRIVDRSMVLHERIDFPPTSLPDDGERALDVLLTLTGGSVGPDARVLLRIEDDIVAIIDPPDLVDGAWQSDPVGWTPKSAVAQVRLELIGQRDGETLEVRDVSLFSTEAPLVGRTLPDM